MSGDNLYIR